MWSMLETRNFLLDFIINRYCSLQSDHKGVRFNLKNFILISFGFMELLKKVPKGEESLPQG